MQTLRSAVKNDLPAIKQLLQATNLPLDDIEPHIANFEVMTNNSEIIGVAGIESHYPFALIRSVAIAPEHQNKQLGVKIFTALMNKLYPQNFEAYYLLTETAISFFERFGFTEISRENVPIEIKSTNEFKHICPTTAIVMKKEIN